MILYDPDLPAGRIFEPPVSTVDIPPTILHLFGLDSVPQFQGHSLLPMDAYPAKGVFGETVDKYGEREKGDEFPIYYYREGDLKIIYRERDDQWEMYDLQKDPDEKENIVSLSPRTQDFMSKLRPRVHRWS